MGIFGTIVLGYLVGSMLTFGPIMFILGAIITVTFIAGYLEAENTTYLIIYSLSTAFAIWGYRIKDSRYLPSHLKKITGSGFKLMRDRKYEVSIDKLINKLGYEYLVKEGSVPYTVSYSSIHINEHGFYPKVTRDKAKNTIFKEINKDGKVVFYLIFGATFFTCGIILDHLELFGSPKDINKLLLFSLAFMMLSISGGVAVIVNYIIKKSIITEEDISLNYRKYKERVMGIAKEEYQKEAEQKQKEMITAREKARKEKSEKDKKAKEAELKRQRKEEKEKQEEERFEAKLADLHSDIMKSAGSE